MCSFDTASWRKLGRNQCRLAVKCSTGFTTRRILQLVNLLTSMSNFAEHQEVLCSRFCFQLMHASHLLRSMECAIAFRKRFSAFGERSKQLQVPVDLAQQERNNVPRQSFHKQPFLVYSRHDLKVFRSYLLPETPISLLILPIIIS